MARALVEDRVVPGRQGTRRRVHRVLRRVDPWSVLRFSLVFYLCVVTVLLVAGVLLWLAARSAGVIDNVEDFIDELFALDDFHFVASRVLIGSALAGLAVVVLGTLATVLLAVLFNLINRLVGGIEVEFIEEESISSPVV